MALKKVYSSGTKYNYARIEQLNYFRNRLINITILNFEKDSEILNNIDYLELPAAEKIKYSIREGTTEYKKRSVTPTGDVTFEGKAIDENDYNTLSAEDRSEYRVMGGEYEISPKRITSMEFTISLEKIQSFSTEIDLITFSYNWLKTNIDMFKDWKDC